METTMIQKEEVAVINPYAQLYKLEALNTMI